MSVPQEVKPFCRRLQKTISVCRTRQKPSFKLLGRPITFYVTDIPAPVIIGLQSSTDLKLFICNFALHENVTHSAPIQLARSNPWKRQIARDQLVSRMLQRSGKVPRRIPHSPWTKFPPVVDPTRRVTISLKDDIKKELDKKCHYSEDRKKWIDTMVQQLCLPPQTERKIEAQPERQRPQCSYSDWISCLSHPRRDPSIPGGCYSIFYKGEKMRIPKRGPGRRVY